MSILFSETVKIFMQSCIKIIQNLMGMDISILTKTEV